MIEKEIKHYKKVFADVECEDTVGALGGIYEYRILLV